MIDRGIDRISFKEKRRVFYFDRARRTLGAIYDDCNSQSEIRELATSKLIRWFDSPPADSFFDSDYVKEVIGGIDDVRVTKGRNAFIDDMIKLLTPVINVQIENALAFEDVKVASEIESSGFTRLNKRISYGIHDDGTRLQLHLSSSFERKEEIEGFYRDALSKVVDIVRDNPEITTIGGHSWLNATRTYSTMKKRLGFEISDVSEDGRRNARSSDTRKVMDASMSRERFLELYGGE